MNINYFLSAMLQIENISSAVFFLSCASLLGTEPHNSLGKVCEHNSKMTMIHTLTCKWEEWKGKDISYFLTQNVWFIIVTYSYEALHCVGSIQTDKTVEIKRSHTT